MGYWRRYKRQDRFLYVVVSDPKSAKLLALSTAKAVPSPLVMTKPAFHSEDQRSTN